MLEASNVELFIGAPIEHASERAVLEKVVQYFAGRPEWALILANLEIRGRQLDLVVATETLTLVIEAKHFGRSVEGGVNGTWTLRSGGQHHQKSVGNPYQQVLSQKFALLDELKLLTQRAHGYPRACIAICPDIPRGSKIPRSDHKVLITDLAGVSSALSEKSDLRLPLDEWRTIAARLRLYESESCAAACSPVLTANGVLLDSYCANLTRTHSSELLSFQKDVYSLDSVEIDADAIPQHMISTNSDILIRGPSGCGKSLLTKRLTLDLIDAGCLPLLIAAKDFDGSLRDAIDREVTLLGAASGSTFLSAARSAAKDVVLIIDGFNECRGSQQVRLTRSIAAFSRRYQARLVVSTQCDIPLQELISPAVVAVRSPSEQLKLAIASSQPESVQPIALFLLETATTGLEASLIGTLGSKLSGTPSRFALFDTYARAKLGDSAYEGIALLAEFAGQLQQRLTFSMSVRELDRLAAQRGASSATRHALTTSDLIQVRFDRVSFRHELFLHSFAAEHIVRGANGDTGILLSALSKPRYKDCRSLILGAIDDDVTVASILGSTSDPEIIQGSLAGECGIGAQVVARRLCTDALLSTRAESERIEFNFEDEGMDFVGVVPSCVVARSPNQMATLDVVGRNVLHQEFLELILECAALLDEAADRFCSMLPRGERSRRMRVRNSIFSACYLFAHEPTLGLSRIVSAISASWSQRESPSIGPLLSALARPLSDSQLYIALVASRLHSDRSAMLTHVIPLLKTWRFLPSQVTIRLLDLVHFAHPQSEAERTDLISVLEEMLPLVHPLVAATIVESLDNLGARSDEADSHLSWAKSDLAEVLRAQPDDSAAASAWGIYCAQFDHPFSVAFSEAVAALPQAQQAEFLRLACAGANSPSLFLAPLIQELANAGGEEATGAISRWTALPSTDSFMPQESIAAFVGAYCALGRLGAPLPTHPHRVLTDSESALLAIGQLYYWSNRNDLSLTERLRCSLPAQGILSGDGERGAIDAAYLTSRVAVFPRLDEDIVDRYPDLLAGVCRAAVLRPGDQTQYFPNYPFDKHAVMRFAISILGQYGDLGDLAVLRSLSDSPQLGTDAVTAIRTLETRLL